MVILAALYPKSAYLAVFNRFFFVEQDGKNLDQESENKKD